MGPVGWQEMVIIFIVALVLFGPRKLPELGRTLEPPLAPVCPAPSNCSNHGRVSAKAASDRTASSLLPCCYSGSCALKAGMVPIHCG